ncbi:MAG: hypothetical protein WBM46_05790 [Polyangiales bacterium]|jgi:hypothetical protein
MASPEAFLTHGAPIATLAGAVLSDPNATVREAGADGWILNGQQWGRTVGLVSSAFWRTARLSAVPEQHQACQRRAGGV